MKVFKVFFYTMIVSAIGYYFISIANHSYDPMKWDGIGGSLTWGCLTFAALTAFGISSYLAQD